MNVTPVRLLLLEDNANDALLVRAALAQEAPGEFTITTAERLADALVRIDAEPFDAMLCDLGLPDSAGLATPRAIVAKAPTLPLVVLTGSNDEDLGRAAIEIGAQDYLVKDEAKPSLARRLRHAMERKRLDAELRLANEALEQRVAERTAQLETAYRSLRESEAHYRQLFEANPHPMWVYDRETLAFLAVNDAAVAHYGWSREEFLAMTLKDIRPPETIPALIEHLARDNDKSIRIVNSSKHRKKDGMPIDVEISSLPVNFAGRLARIVAAYDITERKRAEAALARESDRNQVFLRNASDGVHIVDAHGKVLEVSDSFCRMLGYAREELIGADLSLWDAQWSAQQLQQRLAELIATRDRADFETRHRRRDGSVFDVEIACQALDLEGQPVLFASARDITEKKRAEAKIKNYVAQLEIAFMSTVEVATTLSEMRDPYTVGHERRVAKIAVAIAVELGFDQSRQEGLRVAGLLHDIGKITVPAEILSKPGKLTSLEYQLIMRHAQASYDVLKDVPFPWPVATIALQHHERMDGSGYPQGLKGEAILLEARILAVADVIEAMSAHRPYRGALGIEAALAEIERGRGTAFDPIVADACLKLFRGKGYVIPE